jgi:hypothetical protein
MTVTTHGCDVNADFRPGPGPADSPSAQLRRRSCDRSAYPESFGNLLDNQRGNN